MPPDDLTEAYRYCEETKQSRSVVLKIEGGNLISQFYEQVNTVPLSELHLHLDHGRLFFTHEQAKEYFIVSDVNFLTALERAGARRQLQEQIVQVRAQLKERRATQAAVSFGMLIAVFLFVAALGWLLDAGVETMSDLIPPPVEVMLGNSITSKFRERNSGSDSADAERLKTIGKRLVEQVGPTPYKFDFVVEDDNHLNAFAIPGGNVIVLSKLMHEAKNDDEIACVVAHELGHVISRHSLRAFVRRVGAATLVAVLLGDSDNALTKGMSALTQLKYNRQQEGEADRIGVDLAYKAHYDPTALIGFFNRLKKEESQNDMNFLEFVSDHPMVDSRITAINAEISRLRRTNSR